MDHVRLSEGLEPYERYRRDRGVQEQTLREQRYLYLRYQQWYGDVQMRHLRQERVVQWFYARARPLSPATHNAYRARLASFFAHAMRRGWIRVDPMVDVHRMRVPQRLRQRPAPDLLADVIDQADDDRDRAILATLVTTALRQNSVRLLRIGDVDLAQGWLRVNVTKTLQHDELDSALRRWLISYAATIDRPLREQDHLFPARFVRGYRWRTLKDGTREKYRAPDGWHPERPVGHVERIAKAALARIGADAKGEGAHTFRRAAARVMYDRLVSEGHDSAIRVVQALLHHSTQATTELYLGPTTEKSRRNKMLRGQSFLTLPPETGGNVVPLRHDA